MATAATVTQKEEIGLGEAAAAAAVYFKQLYPEKEVGNLLLEEIERDEKDFWQVTLGFDVIRKEIAKDPFRSKQSQTPELVTRRIYKRFLVDPKTGIVKSMKIRQVG